MENIDSEQVYSQLYRTFIKSCRRLPYSSWEQFVARTRIDQFKMKDIMTSADRWSTHSYFIISGLVMSYCEIGRKKNVKWIRGENGYAFSADTYTTDRSRKPPISGDSLMALEDTVVVSISHEDLDWICKSIPKINMAVLNFYMSYTNMYRRLELKLYGPKERYENIQRASNFSFDRVPDVYLASYLGISPEDLRKVRELQKIGK